MHVYVADRQVNETFHCYTHYNKNGVLKDFIYTMIYQPCKDTEHLGASTDKPILRSMSGQTIATSSGASDGMVWAQNNGEGWNYMDYGMVQMLQWLAVLIARSLDLNAIFGGGRNINVSSPVNVNLTTGEFDKKGLFYAKDNSRTSGMKAFGMDNLLGNAWKWINGCAFASNLRFRYKLTETTLDGSTKNGYATDTSDAQLAGYLEDVPLTYNSGSGAIKRIVLNERGIFPVAISTDASNPVFQHPDGFYFVNKNGFACWFGGWYGGRGGFFTAAINHPANFTHQDHGHSLAYKPI